MDMALATKITKVMGTANRADTAAEPPWLVALAREVDTKMADSMASWRVWTAVEGYRQRLAREWQPQEMNSALWLLRDVEARLSAEDRTTLRLRTALLKTWWPFAAREALTYHFAHPVETAHAAKAAGLSVDDFLLSDVESDLIHEQQQMQAECGVPTPRHGLLLASLPAVRQATGYSQETLAALAGVGKRMLTHAESQHGITKVSTAHKLAEALDVQIADLL